MTKPTPKQIAEDVKKLKEMKPQVPRRTVFGDDNWAAIDAQIEVMENKYSDARILGMHESAQRQEMDDDMWYPEHIKDNALDAWSWMDGQEATSPSEGWAGLARKK